MNCIKLTNIVVTGNRVEINYEVKGKIKKYFRENTFWMEFQENIEFVPNGVLVIPFLGDILPLIWVTNSKLVINEIDEAFYESIKNIKKAYEDMYPKLNFLGELEVGNIVDYSYEPIQKSCQFFSGGVDSVATFVNRKSESPDLITLWGADVGINKNEQWEVVEKFVREYGENYNLKNAIIKSNFRKIYSTHKLNKVYREKMEGDWWHNMQHGIGIITHGIIHAYIHKIQIIYMPGSFTIKSKNVKCASYPTIDEAVKFCGKGHVIHEGFQYSRQDKVSLISDYTRKTKEKLKLRVCWEGDNGDNCNHCEKCLRTIVNLILEGEDPKDYGFNLEKKDLKAIMENENISFNKENWIRMKEKYEQDIEFWKDDEDMKWLGSLDIEGQNERNLQKRKNFFIKTYRKIENKFKKN